MSKKLGRNDPCHCGSGKKYKRCHMAEDDVKHLSAAAESELEETGQEALVPATPKAGSLTSALRKLTGKDSREDPAPKESLSDAEPILAYLEHKEDIEKCSKLLEDYRDEYEKLMEDDDAFVHRADNLFAEDTFAPYQFTTREVERAFKKVGYPHPDLPHEVNRERLDKALLFLADDKRRSRLSMSLLQLLPKYVEARRYLDAWLIQDSALLTAEVKQDTNPFLHAMFHRGFEEWAREADDRNKTMLHELGLDRETIGKMTPKEIDAFMQAKEADPAWTARIEAFLNKAPSQRAIAAEQVYAMERQAGAILLRDDASDLLLPQEDVLPWIESIMQACHQAWGTSSNDSVKASLSEDQAKAAFEAMRPVIKEMAGSIFTQQRLQEQVGKLRKYRDQQFDAGRKEIAAAAATVALTLEGEQEPGLNPFLNKLCFTSLFRVGRTGTGGAPEAGFGDGDKDARKPEAPADDPHHGKPT